MGQTLTHGIYLPDEGERNCYDGLAGNWQLLDGAVGTVAEHTTQIAGKASATHTHGNITNDGKLATASKALVTDSNKNITTSSVSDTELGYLSGVTSAIQTQLNAKAADADVVHKTGNETIGGNKKFSLAIELLNGRIYRDAASLAKGTLPSERTYYGITNDFALDSSDSSHRINQCRCWVEANGDNVMEWNLSAWNTTNLATLRLSVAADGSNKTYVIGATTIPEGNSVHDLGTSTNKWKSINGINPGALSFPEGTTSNANTTFNPDLTDWLTDGTGFTITAQVTGWLHIRIQNSTGNFAWVKRASAGSNQTWGIVGNSDTNSDIADIPLNVPVVQGYVYTLKLKTSRLSAAIFMCLGNV